MKPPGSPATRVATCACGQLQAVCAGEPERVSVCHCLECQRRSGSAFAAQARWPEAAVVLTGAFREWMRIGDGGGRATFRFCPDCGGTLAYTIDALPGLVAIPLGTFADPAFPAPQVSGFEQRRHRWVAIAGDAIAHFD